MYTAVTGGSSMDKSKLNTLGIPLSNRDDDDSIFVPYVSVNYFPVLYLTEDDADNDNTGAALWVGNNITIPANSETQASNVDLTIDGATTNVSAYLNADKYTRLSTHAGADSSKLITADAYAYANGKILFIDEDCDASDYGTNFILFTSEWKGDGASKITFKNMQWVNQAKVAIRNIVFESDAGQSGGNIAGYTGTNGFTTKTGTSGNIDVSGCTNVYFQNNVCENTVGTTNFFKTEGCQSTNISGNKVTGAGLTTYGNKQNRCNVAYGIPTGLTDGGENNTVVSRIWENELDGNGINDFDLINVWGGVSGWIKNNHIKGSRFDGMDVYTSGENMEISSNIIDGSHRIGIQTKIDTGSNDRDSIGAGKNQRLTIHDNIILNTGPVSGSPSSVSNVTDIAGIMVLFSDDSGKIVTPTNDDFINHCTIHDNIIINVNDDDDMADALCRIYGISLDGYHLNAHHNEITGVRRQPASSAVNTGVGISINSVGVGAVNNITVDTNHVSAEVLGIYNNGTVSKGGNINNIRLLNNQVRRDDTQTDQDMSFGGVYISPGVRDVNISGGSIDSAGPCITIRRDFDGVKVDNVKFEGDDKGVRLEGYGDNLKISNCEFDVADERVFVDSSPASNWDTLSNVWIFESLTGEGDIDLTFDNAATGGIKGVNLRANHFPNDSRFVLNGFDNTSGNLITRFRARGNDFDDMSGGEAIDLARVSSFKVSDNTIDCGANTGQLIASLPSSVADGMISENEGTTASGALVNVGSSTNVTSRNNVII